MDCFRGNFRGSDFRKKLPPAWAERLIPVPGSVGRSFTGLHAPKFDAARWDRSTFSRQKGIRLFSRSLRLIELSDKLFRPHGKGP